MKKQNHIRAFALIAVLMGATLLQGCGGGGAINELTDDERHLRNRASDLAAPDQPGWAANLGSSILNFDMPWSSREGAGDSDNSYINGMFRRRFDSQDARYSAMADDALRAEQALETFAISAEQVAGEDEARLAGLIAMIASGDAENNDMVSTMNRVRRNRMAVNDGVVEAQSWAQTFGEARDRAEMEVPGSAQAAQLARSVQQMDHWSNELVRISDRMNTSSDRVAAAFRGGR